MLQRNTSHKKQVSQTNYRIEVIQVHFRVGFSHSTGWGDALNGSCKGGIGFAKDNRVLGGILFYRTSWWLQVFRSTQNCSKYCSSSRRHCFYWWPVAAIEGTGGSDWASKSRNIRATHRFPSAFYGKRSSILYHVKTETSWTAAWRPVVLTHSVHVVRIAESHASTWRRQVPGLPGEKHVFPLLPRMVCCRGKYAYLMMGIPIEKMFWNRMWLGIPWVTMEIGFHGICNAENFIRSGREFTVSF